MHHVAKAGAGPGCHNQSVVSMSTHSRIPNYATCPVCKREITVTKAGKLRAHDDPARRDPNLPFGRRCAGAGTLVPESALR